MKGGCPDCSYRGADDPIWIVSLPSADAFLHMVKHGSMSTDEFVSYFFPYGAFISRLDLEVEVTDELEINKCLGMVSTQLPMNETLNTASLNVLSEVFSSEES